jgi:predicted neutral ceramidase superfamily lipid hydrolase
MAARGVRNSIQGPEHASPWVLFAWLAGTEYLIAKAVVVLLFCSALGRLLVKRRIDLLNFCAGLTVVFVCLWLDKGAMNRMNIAIVFAVAALASLSSELFLGFSAATVVVGGLSYAIGVGALRLPLQTVDAALTLLFVPAYLTVLSALVQTNRTDRSFSAEPSGRSPT